MKSIKISIGIKTISEENHQNIEKSNEKDIEGEKEEQLWIMIIDCFLKVINKW